MSVLLAIDPGNIDSAFAFIDRETREPLLVGKVPNAQLLGIIDGSWAGTAAWRPATTHVAVEMVASYGMPVGAEVFQTCVWIGRFTQAVRDWRGLEAWPVFRSEVKIAICHDSRAKDANITQALVDRFALGQPNRGKGTKKEPGWFHGFAADIWQAYAVAVTEADRLELESTSANVR